ncbi:MAG: SDR family oxidoreductase, partial [Acidimicrobiia bacterium]|nr:SDR family oxidoreductase [Acidimicrobiia bacterium]
MNDVTFDYRDAAVLVTGGTSGIGHAIATRFADAGAHVTVTGRKAGPADYAADLTRFDYRQLEITDGASVDAVAASLESLDVLVNNAGANFPGGGDEWDPDVFVDALRLNLGGPMRLTMACKSLLAASALSGGASVVNIVSLSAMRSVVFVPGYGSAKAGLIALTANLANLWARDGIRVNAVAPGVIRTRMTAPLEEVPELRDAEIAHTPMRRLGAPEEVTGAVAFLASSSAGFITGTTLVVDGGYL